MRHFHQDFVGRHLVVWSDHRPLVDSFQNPDLQKNDPIALAQMAEIGMFTHDIRFIEGKANVCADMLSRPHGVKLGEAYLIPDHISAVGKNSVGKNRSVGQNSVGENSSSPLTDEVALETFSAENIQKYQ